MNGHRNEIDFPTRFGPPTTRMPPLPDGRGKRKSTWSEQRQPMKPGENARGSSGSKRVHARDDEQRRRNRRRQARRSRARNREVRA